MLRIARGRTDRVVFIGGNLVNTLLGLVCLGAAANFHLDGPTTNSPTTRALLTAAALLAGFVLLTLRRRTAVDRVRGAVEQRVGLGLPGTTLLVALWPRQTARLGQLRAVRVCVEVDHRQHTRQHPIELVGKAPQATPLRLATFQRQGSARRAAREVAGALDLPVDKD